MTGANRSRRAPPEQQVGAMFDNIVGRYDLLNGLLSFGLDRRWRRATVDAVGAPSGATVLDLGCGTGDMTRMIGAAGARPIGIDLSRGMLLEARRKLGPGARLLQASAYALPFPGGTFAAATSGFVLRNLDDLPKAFAELARVVEPGGRVALLDITEPTNRLLRRAFDAYFETAAPALGGLVGKREAYRYLVRSLAQLPPPRDVSALLQGAGFEDVRARPLTRGVVTLFTVTRR